MPTYACVCNACDWRGDRIASIAERDEIPCPRGCSVIDDFDADDNAIEVPLFMVRELAAPLFKFAGRVTPGGGPDRFTADMLGVPLKELPSGLRTQ